MQGPQDTTFYNLLSGGSVTYHYDRLDLFDVLVVESVEEEKEQSDNDESKTHSDNEEDQLLITLYSVLHI